MDGSLRPGSVPGARSALLLPWVLGPVALSVVVGGTAALAQHDGRAQLQAAGGGAITAFPLLPHMLVMVAVGAFAVTGARGLLRAGARVAAGLPLVAAAAGPMAIVAAPARASLVSVTTGDTALGWHLAVGAVVLAVLTVWSVMLVRRAPTARPLATPHPSPAFLLLVLAAVSVLTLVAVAPEPAPTAPRAVPVVTWSVLAATAAVVVATERWREVAAMAALALAAVLGFPLAYRRDSAGAAVPGWEVAGTSPVVLSTLLGVVVVAGVLVGVVLRFAAPRLASRRSRWVVSAQGPGRPLST